ncbi:hypothetical protein ACWGKQ_17895 [Streptomyces sp. NPDC054770]
MQRFAGAARAVAPADIALSVATCTFSSEAQAIAELSGVITVQFGDNAPPLRGPARASVSAVPSAACACCRPSAPVPARPTPRTGSGSCTPACTSSG